MLTSAIMIEFFRNGPSKAGGLYINKGYWAEKLQATDKHGNVEEFSYELFKEYIRERVSDHEQESKPDDADLTAIAKHKAAYEELRNAIEDEVLSCDENDVRCFDSANNFLHSGEAWKKFHGKDSSFEFRDLWDSFDSATKEYTYHFIWCCYALSWGIKKFDEATEKQGVTGL